MEEAGVMAKSSPRVRARKRAHRCYEMAVKGQIQAPDWTIVHGTVLVLGSPVGHGWLERDSEVYDPVDDKFFEQQRYYSERGAVARGRYSPKQSSARSSSKSGCLVRGAGGSAHEKLVKAEARPPCRDQRGYLASPQLLEYLQISPKKALAFVPR
jgi:hypothetical protein